MSRQSLPSRRKADGVRPQATLRKSGSRRHHFENGRFLTEHAAQLSPAEVEFGKAVDAFKRANRNPVPSWEEIHQILLTLGYMPDPTFFANRMRRYMSKRGMRFPTCAQVLAAAMELGYVKGQGPRVA